MALLGLDISTAAGFAVDDGTRTFAWTWTARVARPNGLNPHDIHAGYHGEIARQFADELREALERYDIERVAIEKPIPPNGFGGGRDEVTNPAPFGGIQIKRGRRSAPTSFNVSYLMLGLPMVASMVCRETGVPVQFVPIPTWRKAFLGCTRAPKSVDGDAKRRKWLKDRCVELCHREGLEIDTDNAADAVGIVRCLRAKVKAARLAPRSPSGGVSARAAAEDLFRS